MNESSITAGGGNEVQVLHRVLFSGEVLLAVFHVSVCTARDAVFTSSTYESVTVTTLPISSQLSQFFLVCWLCLCLTSSNFLLSLFLSLSSSVPTPCLLHLCWMESIQLTDQSTNQRWYNLVECTSSLPNTAFILSSNYQRAQVG